MFGDIATRNRTMDDKLDMLLPNKNNNLGTYDLQIQPANEYWQPFWQVTEGIFTLLYLVQRVFIARK